jgi:hypothetical protein
MARQALACAVPPAHRCPQRARPKLDGVIALIDRVLEEDRRVPRKPRQTAERLHRRILEEFPGCDVGESTVRNNVRARRHQFGLVLRETFVPQHSSGGQEAQMDWYEACADLDAGAAEVGEEASSAGCFGRRSAFCVLPALARPKKSQYPDRFVGLAPTYGPAR